MSDKSDYSRGENNYIRDIFDRIAPRYDLINRVISLGQLNRWRRKMIDILQPDEDSRVLDICCGTGRLTFALAKRVSEGHVIGVDFSREMIERARESLDNCGYDGVEFQMGNAMDLEFPSSHFDCVVSAFGLRNISNLDKALTEFKRVLKPGGKMVSLELGRPRNSMFRGLYNVYFHRIMPWIAGTIVGDREPYVYFSASLKKFPDQEKLKQIYSEAGFDSVKYEELMAGTAVVHHSRLACRERKSSPFRK